MRLHSGVAVALFVCLTIRRRMSIPTIVGNKTQLEQADTRGTIREQLAADRLARADKHEKAKALRGKRAASDKKEASK